MHQQPSVALDTIQIRYRISYLTWLRMRAWAQHQHLSVSVACGDLLDLALSEQGVANDPAVLLGLSEGSPKGRGEEG